MDPFTLHMTDALVNFTCGITVAILWMKRPAETCFAFWSAAFAVFGAALLLKGAVDAHPLLGAVYFGGLGLGIKLVLAGFRNFDDRDGAVLHALPFVVAPPAGFVAFSLALPNTQWPELAAFLLCCALSIRLIAYVLAHSSKRSTYRWLAGVTLAAQLAVTLALVLASGSFVDAGSLAIAVPFADQICTIVLVTCLFGMSVERNEAKMEEMAYRDGLTGALNRMGFLRRVADDAGPSGLLVMDLDHFKSVNDRYGHLGGDAALREFTRRAAACLPEDALFGRMGGEEFVAFLPNTDHAELTAVAQSVRLATRRDPVAWSDAAIAVTVSIGLALRCEGETLESLISRADAALYRAKLDGRDRIAA